MDLAPKCTSERVFGLGYERCSHDRFVVSTMQVYLRVTLCMLREERETQRRAGLDLYLARTESVEAAANGGYTVLFCFQALTVFSFWRTKNKASDQRVEQSAKLHA